MKVLRGPFRRLVAAVATAGGILASAAATAGPIKVVAFAGASNWPYWVAQEKGFFKKEGVEVTLDITPNSVELARNLHAGRYDLALAGVDNIVAYNEGQGEADLGGPTDFVALFGVDNGLLSLMVMPEINSFADLKGKTLSVDAMTTGFAFVLRDLLARNNVENDVKLVRVGGGAQRLEALLKKEQDGTLLNAPLDLVAEARGYKRLARIKEVLGAYQGIVGAARRDHAGERRKDLEGFIRAFHQAVAWLGEPANKEEAITLLTARMRGMERPGAERAYQVLLDPREGMYRDLKVDRDGLRTVLMLRSRYAQPRKELSDPGRYVDESYLANALKK
ncbi:MAG TPA: ABC transporter substrate-binding protein [Beijerinckiaceae bacterium]|jgi:ABC-type nitrate/sulfonate/bicarbonate transport system substrate-binding protein